MSHFFITFIPFKSSCYSYYLFPFTFYKKNAYNLILLFHNYITSVITQISVMHSNTFISNSDILQCYYDINFLLNGYLYG